MKTKNKKIISKKKMKFESQKDIKIFWESQIWKLEIKKNICSLLTVVLNLIVVLLNITILILLILAIVMIVEKITEPNYNPDDSNLFWIILLVSLSISLSLGIIISSFVLIGIKNKNKFNIYQKICLDLNNLLINHEEENIENLEEKIKIIIDKNLLFKKEKLFQTIKKFISEDKIKWT